MIEVACNKVVWVAEVGEDEVVKRGIIGMGRGTGEVDVREEKGAEFYREEFEV